jgi:hypothetical protein
MLGREPDDGGSWGALALVASLNGQLDSDLILQLICQIFDSSADQVADASAVHEGSSLKCLELAGVQPYVDLALSHAAPFSSERSGMRRCDDATERRCLGQGKLKRSEGSAYWSSLAMGKTPSLRLDSLGWGRSAGHTTGAAASGAVVPALRSCPPQAPCMFAVARTMRPRAAGRTHDRRRSRVYHPAASSTAAVSVL